MRLATKAEARCLAFHAMQRHGGCFVWVFDGDVERPGCGAGEPLSIDCHAQSVWPARDCGGAAQACGDSRLAAGQGEDHWHHHDAWESESPLPIRRCGDEEG